MSLSDALFPKRCVGCRKFGAYLCALCFASISFNTSTPCFVCNRGSVDGLTHPTCRSSFVLDGAFSALVYRGIVKKLIYQFKYQPYLTDLQGVLGNLMYEGLIQQEAAYRILSANANLVPIPLEIGKERRRGYNQARILAKNIGRRTNVPFNDLLLRVKKTRSQFALNRDERRVNIKGVFGINPKVIMRKDATIILVDDLVTTGATLLEAARVLKKSGIEKVYGITLAHGQ